MKTQQTIPTLYRLFPNPDGTTPITCSACRKYCRVDVSALLNTHRLLKVLCSCGKRFPVIIDTRDFYRKHTQLTGSYTTFESVDAMGYGCLTVEDLSFTGLKFRTRMPHTIRVGEVVKVKFALDTVHASEIRKSILVRHKQDRLIGAEFCDRQAYDFELTYYLNPS